MKPTILHVINGFRMGGAERTLLRLLQTQDLAGWHPVVVSMASPAHYTPHFEGLGIPVYHLSMNKGIGLLTGLHQMRAIVRRHKPDLVHGWMYHGATMALLYGGKRPILASIRHSLSDWDSDSLSTKSAFAFVRRRGRRAARLLYNSELARAQHESAGYPADRGMVIHNGFDSETMVRDPAASAAVRQALGIDAGARVIGTLGRYHSVKGHELLIDAFARLASDLPDLHLIMGGMGLTSDNAALAAAAARSPDPARVHLLGPRTDTAAVLGAMDLFVNASKGESFPNAVAEAMLCNCPAVATDVGETALIVGDTGRLVAPGSAEPIAAAVADLLARPAAERRALGKQARRRIVERFSLSAEAGAYDSLYEEILAAPAVAAPAAVD